MLSRASDFIVRQSKLRASKLSPKSPLSPARSPVFKSSEGSIPKQDSTVSRDSEANCSADEDEMNLARYGHSAHRSSMIKKYSLDTYFMGPSARKPIRQDTRPQQPGLVPERDPSEVVLMKAWSTQEGPDGEETKSARLDSY